MIQLNHALNSLSADDRSLIALAYIQELQGAEAAEILECSPAAYRTRLHRARQRLALLLQSADAGSSDLPSRSATSGGSKSLMWVKRLVFSVGSVSGLLYGFLQLISFVFGVWTATSAA